MEKIIIKKEQDNAILYLRKELGYSFEDFMRVQLSGGWANTVEATPLNELSAETLACALLEGYTIEQEPEEMLYDYYSYHKSMSKDDYHLGVVEGINNTLDCFNIEIKGINIK